jgi:hypothetical protein
MTDKTHSTSVVVALAMMSLIAVLFTFAPQARAAEPEADYPCDCNTGTPECAACEREHRPAPKAPPFRPWQMAWQCSDVRVTVTEAKQGVTTFDLSGSIVGGSQFTTVIQMAGYVPVFDLYFNGRPCAQLPSPMVRQ